MDTVNRIKKLVKLTMRLADFDCTQPFLQKIRKEFEELIIRVSGESVLYQTM